MTGGAETPAAQAAKSRSRAPPSKPAAASKDSRNTARTRARIVSPRQLSATRQSRPRRSGMAGGQRQPDKCVTTAGAGLDADGAAQQRGPLAGDGERPRRIGLPAPPARPPPVPGARTPTD